MRIVKIKDKMGYAVIGVVKVIPDKNGVAVSETKFDNGGVQYRFKVKGASKQIVKRDGSPMWKSQRMWCRVGDDSPFAPIVKNLALGDVVFLFGGIQSNKFADDEGRTRRTTYCTVEYIQPIVASGGQVEAESAPDDDDDFDF